MKPKILKLLTNFLLLIPLYLVFFVAGCDKEITESEPEPEPIEEICDYQLTETDPIKLIIGRWKRIKVGDRIVEPEEVYYWEFEPDSSATYQKLNDGKLDTVLYLRYWIEAEPELDDFPLLHFYKDGGFPLTPWYYQFFDNCTLKVGNAFPLLGPVDYTFKRTNE